MPWKRGCKVLALWTLSAQVKNSWVLVTGGDVGFQVKWFKLYDGGSTTGDTAPGFINTYTTLLPLSK